jgi:hypothetical protein
VRADVSRRWLLQDHVAAAFQVAHQMIRGNAGHAVIRVSDALPAVEPQSMSDRLPDVIMAHDREAREFIRGKLGGVGHGLMVARRRERSKNMDA